MNPEQDQDAALAKRLTANEIEHTRKLIEQQETVVRKATQRLAELREQLAYLQTKR